MFRSILFFILSLFLFFGCSSTKELPTKTVFPFQYQGENYEIVSLNDPSGEGANLLIKKDGDKAIFRSRDFNQDGQIDLVYTGKISLEEATAIYQYGITKAIELGKFKSRFTPRLYEYIDDQYLYSIQTYGLFLTEIYNEFVIRNIYTGFEQRFMDMDANGQLDVVTSSDISLEKAQNIYRKTLERGLEEQQIENKNQKFMVSVKSRHSAP